MSLSTAAAAQSTFIIMYSIVYSLYTLIYSIVCYSISFYNNSCPFYYHSCHPFYSQKVTLYIIVAIFTQKTFATRLLQLQLHKNVSLSLVTGLFFLDFYINKPYGCLDCFIWMCLCPAAATATEAFECKQDKLMQGQTT